ncbi:MAG: CoA transferase [Myxococcales bacterium]|nr:CoA transferase [Myxococcales bacterium]
MSSLAGLKVVDVATLFAGPMIATVLGDHGADVIKVEHPRGDPVRTHGYSKDGVPLWWKALGRNKHAVTLNLSKPQGAELLARLVADADVLIENFRPGTLERWGIGPEQLLARNPRLIVVRVTGFGQSGPYASRPGFGTLAESMSGFAFLNGQPDGPPTLPPFGFADGVAALAGVGAVMMALYRRDVGAAADNAQAGRGQVVDLALIDPILGVLGPQPTFYDQLGIIPEREGNRSLHNAPRNIYQCKDGSWVAVSTSAQAIAERVMRLVGHPEVIDEPWFGSGRERAKRADLLDAHVSGWIGQHDLDQVISAFEAAQAAVAPVNNVEQVMNDAQYRARGSIVAVEDDELGTVRMPGPMFKLSDTPGGVRWAGRALGADNDAIYGERLGLGADALAKLRSGGVI